jgi:hypothetical protein
LLRTSSISGYTKLPRDQCAVNNQGERSMADVAEATQAPIEPQAISFYGTPRNLVPGMALVLAGALAFTMHMTNVFFAEAMAWVFVIWGLMLIYAGLLDIYQIFTVTDDALIVYNPLRPWGRTKEWAWSDINRMDVIVRKKDIRPQDAKQQVYYQAPGELALEREDHAFDPKLAQLIVERAGLRPADKANPKDMAQLPTEIKATFTWQR